ncbi:hypothetical protein Nmel_003673 [Mimus melanotis]
MRASGCDIPAAGVGPPKQALALESPGVEEMAISPLACHCPSGLGEKCHVCPCQDRPEDSKSLAGPLPSPFILALLLMPWVLGPAPAGQGPGMMLSPCCDAADAAPGARGSFQEYWKVKPEFVGYFKPPIIIIVRNIRSTNLSVEREWDVVDQCWCGR